MAVPGFGQAPELSETTGKSRRPRASERAAVRCGCWLEHDDATIYGTTLDLGRGGLFVRTALPIDPGAGVRVTLTLPDARGRVTAEGQIVHRVRPGQGDRAGLGVRFVELADGHVLGAFLGATLLSDLHGAPDVG